MASILLLIRPASFVELKLNQKNNVTQNMASRANLNIQGSDGGGASKVGQGGMLVLPLITFLLYLQTSPRASIQSSSYKIF